MQTKVMTAKEAINSYVKNGDCLAIGGFVTNRRPYALVREIIRQHIGNLYIEGGPSGGDIDMLIGAGLVTAINTAYISNAAFSMVCRRYGEAVVQHKILNEDYSMDVQTIAYHGAALGLPYVRLKTCLDLIWPTNGEYQPRNEKNMINFPTRNLYCRKIPLPLAVCSALYLHRK